MDLIFSKWHCDFVLKKAVFLWVQMTISNEWIKMEKLHRLLCFKAQPLQRISKAEKDNVTGIFSFKVLKVIHHQFWDTTLKMQASSYRAILQLNDEFYSNGLRLLFAINIHNCSRSTLPLSWFSFSIKKTSWAFIREQCACV